MVWHGHLHWVDVQVAIIPFIRGADGQAEQDGIGIAAVILCPYSFEGSPRPDSYHDANNLLALRTNLADAVPKSTTLPHEAFHAIFGTAFLSGAAEAFDIARCLNLATSNVEAARTNPENYVFFIVHMYHLFGKKSGNSPWSISKQWDFKVHGTARGRIYGAIEPPEPE
ncbi:uncharacterized protein B0H64DRAFT_445099 [Chaetomium fimeti]|uniref:Uncharacterized protein n=1 Tax=Chaetomium fimeti TaxID=1854472 RepID=A0AAE0H964_9PEZI|nr:hypothetical protein B0H64DRAFT_445099 [Chaetomium fimeti]